jgi:hypothetical protein
MASYIRGKLNVACCDLMDELAEIGINAAVGHLGSAKRGLVVRPRSRKGVDQIPSTYQGMPVLVEFEKQKNDPLVTSSPLVQEVQNTCLNHGLPLNAIAAIEQIIESWENDPAEWTSQRDGFLMVGIDPEIRNVVIDLGKDRCGHINFTSTQARALAANIIDKAEQLEQIVV